MNTITVAPKAANVTKVSTASDLPATKTKPEPRSKSAPAMVATTALQMVENVLADHGKATTPERISIHGHTLMEMAKDALQGVDNVTEEMDESGLFYRAAAALSGAVALDRSDAPTCTARHALTMEAFELVNSASISFGFAEEPCEALATGISAGQASGASSNGNGALNGAQLAVVLKTIAGNTHTLLQLLMLLQRAEIEDQFTQGVCIDAAADLARSIGAMADESTGAGIIGDAACWLFGPNFDSTGKAGQS